MKTLRVVLAARSFLLCVAAGWGLMLPTDLSAVPGVGQPLQLIRGEVRRVGSAAELRAALEAANRAQVPATILLADGTYVLKETLNLQCPGLVLRSERGDRDAVFVRGPDEGPKAELANVFLVSANDVAIADLSMGYCRYHGIQARGERPYDVSGLLVHNCRLVNCNEQFIKGSSSEEDPVGATDGCVEQCLFEFTSGWGYQYYTGGIDIHKGVNWIVRDNLFRNLRNPAGQPGMAEHAVHFWKRCPTRPQNVVVERNWIVNCDRGIGFGLVSAEGGHWGGASAIRNNLVYNDGAGPRTDVGIGLEHASDVRVDNNTVVIQNYWAPVEYRFAGSSNLVFRNNLANGAIRLRDGAPQAPVTNNLERVEADWFAGLAVGDLRLTAAARPAIDRGMALADFTDDLDGQTRPRGEAWDIGASEWGGSNAATEAAPPVGKGLPAGLLFVPGPVNGALLSRQGKTLAFYGDPTARCPAADAVLLCEARRDAIWLALGLARRGARTVVPAKEAQVLESPEKFWAEWRERRFHDYAQQSSQVAAEAFPVGRRIAGGETIEWAGLPIRVLDTPGYTRGAVSYLFELEGKKVVFTGDLIRDDGKLHDLFSLQDEIPEAKIGGYHGWAGRLGDLMASLERVAAERPDLLIPLRGPIVRDPGAAIARLQSRIRALYANYLSVDALRWYFKDEHILAKARRVLGEGARVDWMEMAETVPLPANLLAISNSRLLIAADGAGFLVDCGGAGIVEELRKLRAAGKLKSVEHVFVTHYHDDHTDALPMLVREFGAQVHACGSLIDVLEHPGDYRLPCLTKNPVAVTARHQDGDAWRWKEYRLTIHDFPGQTLHHNALLVEEQGRATCFVGDSFTPSGIDDYCLQNRNFLREGAGYLGCLARLESLPPGCYLINQHVEPEFRFSRAQIARMRSTLRGRIPLARAVTPFDDPNFALDEGWVSTRPYWATLRGGETAEIELRITNHSERPHKFDAQWRAPKGLQFAPRRRWRFRRERWASHGAVCGWPPAILPVCMSCQWMSCGRRRPSASGRRR